MATIFSGNIPFESLTNVPLTVGGDYISRPFYNFLFDLHRRTGGTINGVLSNNLLTETSSTLTLVSGATLTFASGSTVNFEGAFQINGTTITVTGAQLNYFDAISAPTNGQILVGNTATNRYNTATLNAAAGLTATFGAGTLQLDVDIANESTVSVASGDYLLIADVSAANAIKKVTAGDIASLSADTFATIQVDGVAQSTNAPTLDFDGTDFLLTESPTDDFDITIKDSGIDHNSTTNYVANKHIDHTSVTLTAGGGLSGGGDISTSRSFAVDPTDATTVTAATGDLVLIADVSDSNNLKNTTVDDIAALAGAVSNQEAYQRILMGVL